MAMRYIQSKQYRRVIIVTDSMSTLQKISKENLYADWGPIISSRKLERLIWVFSPGHDGVEGNERADSFAGTAAVDNNLTNDPPTVIQCVTEQVVTSRPESSSYTLSLLKDKGVQPSEAANCNNRGITRHPSPAESTPD